MVLGSAEIEYYLKIGAIIEIPEALKIKIKEEQGIEPDYLIPHLAFVYKSKPLEVW
jgi:hypothetical protein